ncbi:nuclease-related domain-containing protein [Alkalihalobacterium alkalinitrilicum]|uniref:nuclease-related domain-containing protein n=1 Tax=Alkalihalobacterium alkalinitrilicum TaxID=427920 RepID=UPI001EE48E1C|nr:nuclease-related domain-containing protein [Alkalihalobacterium alkalinitrilicum]
MHNTFFQIDTLLITTEKIYLFEVKNYEGDFLIEDDKWYTLTKTEIKNPVLQVKRSEFLFQRLLQELGFNTFITSLETYLIFMNPHFQLYQAPLNMQIIFPTQLKRFLNNLNKKSTNQLTEKHSQLAEKLLTRKTVNYSP